MQLNGKTSVKIALTAITASLLGVGAAHSTDDTKVESSMLLYSEQNRVQAAEGIFSMTKLLKNDRIFNARFTLDGLTGASPNGATPANQIQTFTRPSGNGSYTVKAGKIPLDDTFKDTRYSFDGSLTQPLNPMTSLVIGAHLSTEHDYTSFGANFGITRNINRKNTTFAASAAFSHDLVRPSGGDPTPLSSMTPPSVQVGEEEGEGSGATLSKNVFDAVAGVTQVLDRKTLLRLNYSYSHYSGYLNDPYKLVSVVQGPNDTQPGEPIDYIYEARPDNRNKQAFYAEIRRYIGGHTIDLSYRYFWDNWGISSQTMDLFYHLPLRANHALQPHFRYYKQTEADFYNSYLVNSNPTPSIASADYRLAPFHAITVGMEYLFPVAEVAHMSIGVEYYTQIGDLSPPSSMGILSQTELFPKIKAMMIRVGFSYGL